MSGDPAPTVRRAAQSESLRLAELHVATVTVAYADIFPADAAPPAPRDLEPAYRDLLDDSRDPRSQVHVAESATGALLGTIGIVEDLSVPEGVRIERFNVLPTAQGRGVGRVLYERALEVLLDWPAQSANLWVLEANGRARSIYEHWGWTRVAGWTLANDPPEILDVLYRIDLDAP